VILVITVAGYCVLGGLIVVLALLSRSRPERVIPFGELIDRTIVSRSARVAIIVCWWWLGWHFLFAQTV